MADTLIQLGNLGAGPSAEPVSVKARDNGDGTYSLGVYNLLSSDGTITTQVDAASVANGATNVIASTPTLGARWARVTISCNQSHDVDFYGYTASFAAITAAFKLADYTRTGIAAVSGYGGNSYIVECSGHAHFAIAVTNRSGAAAATVTAKVSFLD